MSSEAVQSSLVLVRRLADGRVEWVPLVSPSQHVAVVPDASYTLIDRANYEAPKALQAEREGEDLVVDVEGSRALVLDGFFTNEHAAFYPTTNIASGAGPFSGPSLTADSLAVADYSTGELVLWSAEQSAPTEVEEAGIVPAAASAGSQGGGSSPLLWAGLAAGALGLAALAGGGGGSGGGGESGASGGTGSTPPPSGGGGSTPPPSGGGGSTPPPDTTAPHFTSGTTAPAIADNSGAGQIVYTAVATDASTVTYSLSSSDGGAFNINANTGAVTLTVNPDFETKPSYTFTVVATDTAGNHSERTVSLAITSVDESAPTITSGGIAPAINENSGAGQVVYTVTSTDASPTTYSLKHVGDWNAFTIDGISGQVTLKANPDFEAQSSYSFTVVATDADHNSSERAVSLQIIDVNDTGPPPDTTPPTLSVSSPANGAQDVPVEQNIVLVFSEDVKLGSGTITIMDHKDDRTIDVSDGSQVSVNGNQVTINPTSDLNSDGDYHVRIDAGAFTDLAGNAFAGGDALHFKTAKEGQLVLATLDSGPALQTDSSAAIDIQTGAVAPSGATGAETPVDASPIAATAAANPMAFIEPTIAWQPETNGIIEGSFPANAAHEVLPAGHDDLETRLDLTHLAITVAGSQGLV
jgi:methionine-rich copper-binding protein CopC